MRYFLFLILMFTAPIFNDKNHCIQMNQYEYGRFTPEMLSEKPTPYFQAQSATVPATTATIGHFTKANMPNMTQPQPVGPKLTPLHRQKYE